MKPAQLQALQQAMKTLVAIQDFWDESGMARLSPDALLLDSEDSIHEAVVLSVKAVEENFPDIMD